MKSLGQVTIFREKSQGFPAATLLRELLEGSCQEKQDHGNSGRNCGRIYIQLCIAPQATHLYLFIDA